jgi:CRISPR-associated protein Csc2
MTISGITTLEKYAGRFCKEIPQTPTGRYVSIILLRETKSYAIFTTEGGEQQDVEQTQAGMSHSERADRLVMFKRKQVAAERRSGKALLRQMGIFPYAIQNGRVIYGEEATKVKGYYNDCYLTAGLCTHCPDCLIYGYAAIEAEGARKSRVMTDSCFSIRPYPFIQRLMKFNVIDEKTQTSGTITEYDYTLPEVFLPSVITTVDLTLDEFVYVLGNILRTTRYGKESSRQGFMRNHILAIAFSDVELFANLELTQALYDALALDPEVNLEEGSLCLDDVKKHIPEVLKRLTEDLYGRLEWVQGEDLEELLGEVRALYSDEARLAEFLRNLNTMSASFVV